MEEFARLIPAAGPPSSVNFLFPQAHEMTVTLPELAIEKLREEELEEARAIQSVMMPSEPLRVGAVRISHAFQPVAAVGGDFLDYFEMSDGSIGLYLGDVSGKGLAAAMYAALAVGTLRGVQKTGQSPCAVLSTMNRRLLVQGVPRRHSATQYAVFDPRTAEMRVSSAGMPGPFHLSAQGCRVLEIPGLPAGLFSEAQYDMSTLTLLPGDSVLFCTDGITDAFNIQDEQFGILRLQSLCENALRIPPQELLRRIFAAVEAFTLGRQQHDDMAAAVFHYGLLTPVRDA
jgi:sigma-B regulation protein RsbU (phosphoserine phosphatase)